MESTYSMSSLVGFVSSKRRLHLPPYCAARPKVRQIDLAWPMCRYPFGSGGKRVQTLPPHFPALTSAATISRMKSEGRDSLSDMGRGTYLAAGAGSTIP